MSEEKENSRIAVVTGAGRGIGKRIAQGLAKDGLHVICISKSESSCGGTAQEINADGGKAEAIAVDVASSNEITKACEEILQKYECVDVLVNNAGITRDGTMHRMTPENW